MIRYSYIDSLVLSIYKELPTLTFPLNPLNVVSLMPNCRYMSYTDFATATHISVKEVISLCGSPFGCTHYERSKNRYLILCNQSLDRNNNLGRQRWTLAHELGHIFCRHFERTDRLPMAQQMNQEIESEADCFAKTLLAPMPLVYHLKTSSVIDVQNTFGLSCEASINVYKRYIKWKNGHYKTAWEDNLIKTYLSKQ